MNQVAELREPILAASFTRTPEPIYFAGGDEANNKLDIEKIKDMPEVYGLVVPALAKLVLEYNPEFVVGVPKGATWLADAVALRADLYCVHLDKEESQNGSKKMSYKNDFIDREVILGNLSRGVIIDDVFNRYTNLTLALQVSGLREKIAAGVAVWDRGAEHIDRQAPIEPCSALIKEHIPAQLSVDSPLWRYAS